MNHGSRRSRSLPTRTVGGQQTLRSKLVRGSLLLTCTVASFALGHAAGESTLETSAEGVAVRDPTDSAARPRPQLRRAPHEQTFRVNAYLQKNGPPKVLLELHRRKLGAFTVAASAIVHDDRGKAHSQEQKPPPRETPPSAGTEKFIFDVPSLDDGFYRVDLLVGWRNGQEESAVSRETVFLRVAGGEPTEENLETWFRESRALVASKKGE